MTDLEEVFRVELEDRVECVVVEVSMLFPAVVVEIHKVFDVVVRSDVFYVLQRKIEQTPII